MEWVGSLVEQRVDYLVVELASWMDYLLAVSWAGYLAELLVVRKVRKEALKVEHLVVLKAFHLVVHLAARLDYL